MVSISFPSIQCASLQSYYQRFQNGIDLNYGGKAILPHRCLNEIATKSQGELPNPMLFKFINKSTKTSTHCGVLDFCNISICAFIPGWMLQQLELQDPADMRVELVHLPIGTYARLRPLNPAFKHIAEPIVVLEICLRQYSCLTVNDVVQIFYNKKVYEFKVESLQPAAAVNIIECDMNVEFSTDEPSSKTALAASDEDNYKVKPGAAESTRFRSFGEPGSGWMRYSQLQLYSGALDFYRRGVLMDDKLDEAKKDGRTIPFSGKGVTLK